MDCIFYKHKNIAFVKLREATFLAKNLLLSISALD